MKARDKVCNQHVKQKEASTRTKKGHEKDNGLLKIHARINGKQIRTLIDCGANVSLVSQAFATRCLRNETSEKEEPYLLSLGDQSHTDVTREITRARFQIEEWTGLWDFDVVEGLSEECILGTDWLDASNAWVNTRQGRIAFTDCLNSDTEQIPKRV